MTRILGIEATQAIQYFKSTHPICLGPSGTRIPCADNSVPLVADKQVVLRVYVSGATPGSHLSAVVTHQSSGLGGFGSSNSVVGFGGIVATAGPSVRSDAATTIQVPLRLYESGTWAFNVIVLEYDPGWTVVGSTSTTMTLTFSERRRIRVRLVRIRYAGRMMNVAPPSLRDFWDMTAFAQRVLPIPAPGFEIVGESEERYDGDFTRIDPSAHDSTWSGYDGNRGTTGNLLNILDRLIGAESLPSDVIYVAIYPENVRQSSFAGWAIGRWIISDRVGETFAHEVLHHVGAPQHGPCGNPANVDPGYPDYPLFSPLPAGSIGEVGFDVTSMRSVDPAATYDLMTYCAPKWISPYNYVRCFNTATPLPKPVPPSGGARPTDFVHFSVLEFPDRWTIVDLPRFSRPLPLPLPPWPPPSGIDVIVRDQAGRTIGRAPLVPDHFESHDNRPLERYDAEVPYVSEAVSLEVVRGNERLARQTLDEAPALDVVFPSREQLERRQGVISYRTKPVHPAVSVAVRASGDGGATWLAIVVEGDGRQVDLATLLESLTGDECVLEILASSGYHTTRALSSAFRLRPRERHLLAWSSAGADSVRRGQPVELVAILDGGSADSSEIRWYSDLSGEVGIGPRFVTTTLAPGRHHIEVRSTRPFVRSACVDVAVD